MNKRRYGSRRQVAAVIGLCFGTCLAVASGAGATTLRVPSEYGTIQAGVDAAAAGDTVLVAPGTYTDVTTRLVNLGGGAGSSTVTAAVILKDGVSVVSEGGSAATILDTSGASVVGAGWPVVGGGFTSVTTRLQGFRIVPSTNWNAVHLQYSATTTFEDIVVEDARHGGGDASGGISAIYSDVVVRSGVFVRCRGLLGGGVSIAAGSAVVEDSRFESCTASIGGGLHIEGDVTLAPGKTVLIARCEFVGNKATFAHGGGVSFSDDQGIVSRVLEDCRFADNESVSIGGGAAVVAGIGPTTFQRNTVIRCGVSGAGGYGGGAFLAGPGTSSVTVRENTFVECYQGSAATGGASVSLGSSTMHVLTHNVIVGSSGATAVRLGGTILDNSCNVYWNNAPGDSNVPLGATDRILDPLFCAPQADDYSLSADSPCLDKNSASCGTVGALGEGCGPVSIEELSWGAIKDRYSGRHR